MLIQGYGDSKELSGGEAEGVVAAGPAVRPYRLILGRA